MTRYDDFKKNKSGYNDPTAYLALQHIKGEEDRFKTLMRTILYIVKLAGFEIDGRITLVDKETGRVWK